MRTVLFLCVLLAALVSGFDFSDLSKPVKTLLDDGHYRFVHTAHHIFNNPDGNQTYFHLDATVEIHKQWNVVDLNDYAGAGGIAVAKICHEAKVASSIISVVTKDATTKASLLSELQKSHTIVKFTGLRCGGQAVFGHFDSIIDTPTNALQVKLQLQNAQLHDVFRHAHVKMSTNHVRSKGYTPEEVDALLAQQRALQQVGPAPSTASRKMDTQWSVGGWFHKTVDKVKTEVHKTVDKAKTDVHKAVHTVEHAVTNVYHHITHTVETVAEDVANIAKQVEDDVYDEAKDLLDKAEDSVKFVSELAQGDINTGTHDWELAKAHFGSSSLMSNPQIAPPSATGVKLETYVGFDLKVIFELHIEDYSVESFETALEVDVYAALALAATYETKGSKSYQLCDLRTESINFMLGWIPVHIQPYIPVSLKMGYDLRGTVQFGATGTGRLVSGVSYSSGQFSPINSHSFKFDKKWDIPQQPDLQVTASLIPSLVLDIDFLGGPIASVSISATMNLVETDDKYYLQFNAHIAPALSAVFKVEVSGYTILGPKTIGPHTFDGTSYNLGRESLPHWLPPSKGRALQVQEVSAGSADSLLIKKLGSKNGPVMGTTWRGGATTSGSCRYDQKVTFQLAGATNTSILFMAVIDISATRYSGTNPTTQQKAISNVIAPYYMTMNDDSTVFSSLVPGDRQDCHTSTTAAWLQANPPSFTARFSQTGDLVISNQVGGVQLCTGAMTLSPDVFTSDAEVLAAAAGSASADNSGSTQTVGIVVGLCIGVVLVAIVVGVVVSRKRNQGSSNSQQGTKELDEIPLETATEQRGRDEELI